MRWKSLLLNIFLLQVFFITLNDIRSSRFFPKVTPHRPRNEKIFIASIHWNNEALLRDYWIPSMISLCEHLGPEHVFVSVLENGSWDGTKDALRHLDEQLEALGIRRTVILEDRTHADEISGPINGEGWIRTPRDRMELRRIPYLARFRNRVLEPLDERYDKVLWLGDVVFSVKDIITLLSTRNGDYAAACSLDFSHPPQFYDTFALRDAEGHAAIMQTWPYFRAWKSRIAVKSGEPVPVKSCWNGVVAMDATPFYNVTQPLHFRGVSDTLAEHHLEGSECCLIHADNPLSEGKGVWLNSHVQVGYNSAAYEAVTSHRPSIQAIIRGSWENRLRRWLTTPWFEELVVSRRMATWRAHNDRNVESGEACLVNEMQVLVENGWAHV